MDLCLENVLIEKVEFIPKDKGSRKVTLPTNMSIKLIDFGAAEIFDVFIELDDYESPDNFKCAKTRIFESDMFQAPELRRGDFYDARAADMWQLGMIYYQAMTGEKLYEPEDMWFEPRNGYWAIMNYQLKNWLSFNDILPYFRKDSFDLLQGLLNINPEQRLSAIECCTHSFFKSYYKKYEHKLNQKIVSDVTKLYQQRQTAKMTKFPYYDLEQ